MENKIDFRSILANNIRLYNYLSNMCREIILKEKVDSTSNKINKMLYTIFLRKLFRISIILFLLKGRLNVYELKIKLKKSGESQ